MKLFFDKPLCLRDECNQSTTENAQYLVKKGRYQKNVNVKYLKTVFYIRKHNNIQVFLCCTQSYLF